MKSKFQPPPGSWDCWTCKNWNLPDHPACQTCGQPRPDNGDIQPKPVRMMDVAGKAEKRPKMNKSEAAVFEMLKAKYPLSLILPQCLKLPFGDNTSYTPDFMFMHPWVTTTLIEVKGGYRGPGWEQGMERYRRAKEKWGKWFVFELWEKKDGEWRVTRCPTLQKPT